MYSLEKEDIQSTNIGQGNVHLILSQGVVNRLQKYRRVTQSAKTAYVTFKIQSSP